MESENMPPVIPISNMKIVENKGTTPKTRKQKRREAFEAEAYQRFLTSLVNQFFKFSQINQALPQLIENELDRIDREWKNYTRKWNANKKRYTVLLGGDFIKIVNAFTKKLSDAEKAKK